MPPSASTITSRNRGSRRRGHGRSDLVDQPITGADPIRPGRRPPRDRRPGSRILGRARPRRDPRGIRSGSDPGRRRRGRRRDRCPRAACRCRGRRSQQIIVRARRGVGRRPARAGRHRRPAGHRPRHPPRSGLSRVHRRGRRYPGHRRPGPGRPGGRCRPVAARPVIAVSGPDSVVCRQAPARCRCRRAPRSGHRRSADQLVVSFVPMIVAASATVATLASATDVAALLQQRAFPSYSFPASLVASRLRPKNTGGAD